MVDLNSDEESDEGDGEGVSWPAREDRGQFQAHRNSMLVHEEHLGRRLSDESNSTEERDLESPCLYRSVENRIFGFGEPLLDDERER